MTNQFPGLARGPIDHNASSVINAIANNVITMGSILKLTTSIVSTEILPRVEEATASGAFSYGIAVGGDIDGIYGTGAAASSDLNRAANAGEGVVVVTQGRCLARVDGTAAITIGAPLTSSATAGVLELADAVGNRIIARALQDVPSGTDIIAVDVQREGLNS